MSESSNFLSSRAWLLILLEAAERAGFIPVSMDVLHRVIYLANVLSPICKLHMPNSYTLKHMRGPYFPSAQWDVGRLSLQGLISATNIEPFHDQNGFWLKADYRITAHGRSLVSDLIQHKTAEHLSTFLREFMIACSYTGENQICRLVDGDIHYEYAVDGEAVDFDYPDGNMAPKAVLLMFPEDRKMTALEGVHRYIDYLEKYTRKKVRENS